MGNFMRMYRTIETKIKDDNDPVIQKMANWCRVNIKGPFTLQKEPAFHDAVTLRTRDIEGAANFCNVFYQYVLK